jgi:hypothetical protein
MIFGDVACQVSGTATAISAEMRCSIQDPRQGGGDPILDAAAPEISGNPSLGKTRSIYAGAGPAWWSVKVLSVTGTATISIAGEV